ncbi:Tubby C-terminal domain-containing protein [Plasmodiophora brassicae]
MDRWGIDDHDEEEEERVPLGRSLRGYLALIADLPSDTPAKANDEEEDGDRAASLRLRRSMAESVEGAMREPDTALWVVDGVALDNDNDPVADPGPSSPPRARESAIAVEAHPTLMQLERDEVRSDGPRIYEWGSIRHVEVIHRQGLHSPALTVVLESGQRPFYKVFVSGNDDLPCLCIRRKSRASKFRLSVDQNVLRKRRNPNYVGKVSFRKPDPDNWIFTVSLETRMPVALITITSRYGKHHVKVVLLNQYLNWHETGATGLGNVNVMTGFINNYLSPVLVLRVEQSNRSVLEIRRFDETQSRSNELVVRFDYPLTVFLSTAITAMVDAHLRSRTNTVLSAA